MTTKIKIESVESVRRPQNAEKRSTATTIAKHRPPAHQLTKSEVGLLEQTFKALAPRGDRSAVQFYAELFARHPGIKPLFDGTDIPTQKAKLHGAFKLAVENLRHPVVLDDALRKTGTQHEDYGSDPAHYAAVADALLDAMEEVAGVHEEMTLEQCG